MNNTFLHLPYQDYIAMFGVPFLMILFFIVNFKEKSLNKIKDREVGDGQYGNARWMNEKEKKSLFDTVVYEPEKWRKGENLESLKQGLVIGLQGNRKQKIAMIDASDSNTVLVGPSGIGKTNFFLIPQIEYAAASGMSFLVTDTKGYAIKKMGNILKKCYGYNVVLLDFRNPLRSDHYNLLQLVNKYMDVYKVQPNTQTGLKALAKCQKYTKIISMSIIESAGFKGGGDNSYFYDSAEGIITSSILLISEFGEAGERHIISVFKLIQELSKNISSEEGNKDLQTEFAKLIQLLPENHKAKWFAGAAVEADLKTALSVFATALSKLTKFIDSELEQIICFDGDFNAEDFVDKKTAVFVVLPEEDKTKYFLFSLFLMQLYREILNIADGKEGLMLKNRVMFFEDEFGTLPTIPDVEMVFSASRSRNVLSVPLIQSFGQLKKNYGEEGKDIILDNCQNILFSGFAPTSNTPEELSKAMGNYTTQSGSVSYSFKYANSRMENQNVSRQMMAKPLMSADQIKRIPKGTFVSLKTGAFPMKIEIPFYSEWGIILDDDFQVNDRDICVPEYISINKLKEKIVEGALEEENESSVNEYGDSTSKKKVIFEKVK